MSLYVKIFFLSQLSTTMYKSKLSKSKSSYLSIDRIEVRRQTKALILHIGHTHLNILHLQVNIGKKLK